MPRLRRAGAVALLLAAGLAVSACPRTLRTVDLLVDRHPDVLYAVDTEAPRVALTIDDGPHPRTTPALLDVLARHDARATFFLLGARVAGREALVRRIVDEGHELGNHGMRDTPAVELSPDDFERQLLEAGRVLAPFQRTCWYRPGSGWYDEVMLDVLARHGYRAALGSSYPLDAQIPTSLLARWWLRLDAEPGEVMVLHDGPGRGGRTAETLAALLPALAREGLEVVTLSQLVASGRGTSADTGPADEPAAPEVGAARRTPPAPGGC